VLFVLFAEDDAAVVGVVVADFPELTLSQADDPASRQDSSQALACSTLECKSCNDVSKQSVLTCRCRPVDGKGGLLLVGMLEK
jgi:hypothetical protein